MARSVLALVACMVLLAPTGLMARALTSMGTSQGSEDTHAPMRFDIDAQALPDALRSFSETAGIAVLFDDDLASGRRSSAVHALLEPRDALRLLLADSGLTAHFSSMNAFTVTAIHSASDALPADAVPSAADGALPDDRVAAAVQEAIERALCARASTRPGHYRLAMQVWIDPAGQVADAVALTPSDDPTRDDRVLSTLRALHLDAAFHRFSPMTILLRPSLNGADPCRGSPVWES
ncbi:hypothetical protein IM816_10350 [Luteibacter flocculans]|uniref:Secretin/TonB short N-terminal domain-containing protein n=1 Tax=Luteibacter flocculans TaxID=2780091 RepID=A0ABY4T1B7_9GAMM|nr:STN domain-containing protein [Luteibacter flocculans]URL57060.1 hypothetical protein IM816_10350 [Luteibacter flocculans]